MDISFGGVVPILRIFDIAKADEFYLGFLGFAVDWDHRFEPGLPLYRRVSRGGLVLHLSEHHGDGCPGARVRVATRGVEALHRELAGKRYGADLTDDVRMRVVADHIRSSLMLMTDGVSPGNEARGYVLRRLLRRSIRAMRLLGVNDPVLPELLPVSRDRMAASYP